MQAVDAAGVDELLPLIVHHRHPLALKGLAQEALPGAVERQHLLGDHTRFTGAKGVEAVTPGPAPALQHRPEACRASLARERDPAEVGPPLRSAAAGLDLAGGGVKQIAALRQQRQRCTPDHLAPALQQPRQQVLGGRTKPGVHQHGAGAISRWLQPVGIGPRFQLRLPPAAHEQVRWPGGTVAE